MKSALCLMSALVATACAQAPVKSAGPQTQPPAPSPTTQQQEAPKKHTNPPVKVSKDPVTREEARETFARAESVFKKALRTAASTGSVSIAASSAPVSREAVVAEMTRFYNVFRESVILTPAPVTYDESRLKLAGPRRADLQKLIRMGMVAPIGPLATGPGSTLTVPQFGDALGFFLARLAYMTHLPSSKWTPALRKEGE